MVEDEKESDIGDAKNNDTHPMDALLDSEEYELEAPKRGEIRVGTIVRVTDSDVLVDIGAKSEGVISARELEQLPEDQRANLNTGQEIDVYIVRSGGRSGAPELSLSRAAEEQDWREAEQLLESKEIYEGEVTGFNKGGLIVKMGRLRGFVPASQVSLARRRRADGESPEDRWGSMVGEHLVSRVIEVDRRRNRLILSERSAAREAREALKERLISELAVGEIRTGHVISLADFGAFVDIGGADGLVHISEISWKRVANPRELLKVGDEVQVKVLGVDPERNRISLSIRELEANPWDTIFDRFAEGQLVEGTITKLTKFGAFASITGLEDFGIEGLIHISELSDRHVEHPNEVVQEGQKLTLRILRIDIIRHRIGLSLKRVDSHEYADQDWQAAIEELSEDEPVADFDAELEAEAALAEESEAGESMEAEAEMPEAEDQLEQEVPTEADKPEADTEAELEAEVPAEADESEADTEAELEAEEPVEADEPEADAEVELEAEAPAETDEPEADTEAELEAEVPVEADEPEADTEAELEAEEPVEADEPEADAEAELEAEVPVEADEPEADAEADTAEAVPESESEDSAEQVGDESSDDSESVETDAALEEQADVTEPEEDEEETEEITPASED
jgi:small subunit ribosomal protein S1